MDPLDPLPPISAPPFLATPERRAKTEHGLVHVAEFTAKFYVAARVLPHPALRAVALFFSGFTKDPYTGTVKPSPQLAGNLAPTPVGYMTPDVYGMKKNWWLLEGSTNYIPRALDRTKVIFDLGLAEQRAEDAVTNANKAAADAAARMKSANWLLQYEPEIILQDLASGEYRYLRTRTLLASSGGIGLNELRAAASDIIVRRDAALPNESAFGPSLPSALPDDGAFPDDFMPAEKVHAPNILQQEAEKRAPALLRNLVSEKADP